MNSAIYKGKDQDFQNGVTIYWFDVVIGCDVELFGVAEGSAGESYVIDCDGVRVDYNKYISNKVLTCCVVTDEMREE